MDSSPLHRHPRPVTGQPRDAERRPSPPQPRRRRGPALAVRLAHRSHPGQPGLGRFDRHRIAAPRPSRLAAAVCLLALLAATLVSLPAGAALPPVGWSEVDLPDGGAALLFRPAGLPVAEPGSPAAAGGGVPLVVFLHGAGGTPQPYRPTVAGAAEGAGVLAVLPKSVTDQGWGWPGDTARILAAVEAVESSVAVDPRRLYLAGHSSGGAYAYLLTYDAGFPAAAVFTLAAPFYPVTRLASGEPTPPIRMYYGTTDPNYTGGSHQRLSSQWQALGVPWEKDVQSGYGHGTWPQGSMDAGFAFLAAASGPGGGGGGEGDECVPGPTVLCLRDGRFRVEVEWRDFQGGQGPGRVVQVQGQGLSGDGSSGLFWFFNEANWELMVKVLDGCGVNGHRWVFSAATTNVAYTLTVRDLATGALWRHDNLAGRPAPAVTDTEAFGCTP